MINIFNGRNIIAVATTLAIGYLISETASEDAFAVFDWATAGSDYKILDVSEFPAELQETARQIKEKAINSLVESGQATREQLAHPRSVLIRYPLDPNSIMSEYYVNIRE